MLFESTPRLLESDARRSQIAAGSRHIRVSEPVADVVIRDARFSRAIFISETPQGQQPTAEDGRDRLPPNVGRTT